MKKSMIVSGALFLGFMGFAGVYGTSSSTSARMVATAPAAEAAVELGAVALQQPADDIWLRNAESNAARNGMDLPLVNFD